MSRPTPRPVARLTTRLVAVLAPAVVLLPAAAHAEKVVTHDAVADAVQADLAEETETPEFVPAPDEASTDIVRTVAAYGDTRLSVTVHFRDLVNTYAQDLFVRIVTPQGSYDLGVSRIPGSRVGAAISRGRGDEDNCRGLRAGFDGGADTMSISVPSACLDDARWVRLGVGAIGFVEPVGGELPDPFALFADDAHRDGSIRDNIAKGPKVRRG